MSHLSDWIVLDLAKQLAPVLRSGDAFANGRSVIKCLSLYEGSRRLDVLLERFEPAVVNCCSSQLSYQENCLASQLQYSRMVEVVHEKVLADSLLVPGQSASSSSGSLPAVCALKSALNIPLVTIDETGELCLDRSDSLDLGPRPAVSSNVFLPLFLIDLVTRWFVVSLNMERSLTLRQCVTYNHSILIDNQAKLQFVIFQILTSVQFCFQRGYIPFSLNLDNFLLDENCWLTLDLARCLSDPSSPVSVNDNRCRKSTPRAPNDTDAEYWYERPLWEATLNWVRGRMSNFLYLTVLNHFAGRRADDPCNHPVFPWICDFSLPEGGWRDLTATKYRLTKGDQQLDQSFNNPAHLAAHHLPELLSDHGYYVYKARLLPKDVLCQHVRSQWVPEEYPSSVCRLFEWTPDECIPEFYSQPQLFSSSHPDMTDLAVPSWCDDGQQFVEWHRKMLESDWVSLRLHHWIDLAFGYKLTGDAAIAAKNVHLALVEKSEQMRGHGPVQLFTSPHPQRHSRDAKGAVLAGAFSMDDAVDMGMNPLYELTQRPAESFQSLSQPFDLVQLARTLYGNQKDAQRSELAEKCLTSLGILLVEICLPQHFRQLPARASMEQRLEQAKKSMRTHKNLIPRHLRAAIRLLLQLGGRPASTDMFQYYQLSAGFLLQPLMDVFNFPHYLAPLHELLDQYVGHKRQFVISLLSASPSDGLSSLFDLTEQQVCSVARNVPPLLPHMPLECIKIVADFARDMLSNPWTSVLAAWSLLNPLAQYLGNKLSAQYFVQLLVTLYDVEQPVSAKHLKLYHRSFLLQLCVRLGTETFLREFTPHLVEAAAGERDAMLLNDEQLSSVLFDSFWTKLKTKPSRLPQHHLCLADSADSVVLDETQSSEAQEDTEQFVLEMAPIRNSAPKDENSLREETSSCGSQDVMCDAFSSQMSIIEENKSSVVLVSSVAKESLLWLAARLGPVLTARQLSRNLLRMMALCYATDRLQSNGDEANVQGDQLAANVIECLVQIASIYGYSFILVQYIPFCADLIQQANKRLTPSAESGVVGCVALLEAIFPFLSDKQLMDNLQEPIVDSILFPAVRLASSFRLEFSDIRLRRLLAWKSARTVHLLGKRVGGDNLKRHMAAPLQRLLCSYDLLYQKNASTGAIERKSLHDNDSLAANETVLSQLQETFSASFASYLLEMFSALCGRRYFQLSLPNADLIMSLAQSTNPQSSSSPPSSGSPSIVRSSSLSMMAGNRLSGVDFPVADEAATVLDHRLHKKLDISKRSLRGNWLAHWEHELGRHEKEQSLYFNQIQLLTLVGHTAAVRRLHVMDNENSFVSASQDKSVKLWSLRSFGDGSAKSEHQWTYKCHKKSLLDLAVVDSLRLVASTDGALHFWIWDPMMGTTLRTFDWISNTQNSAESSGITHVRSFEAPSKFLLVASSEPTLRFLDVRQAKWSHDFKISPATNLSIRSVAVDRNETWVAVGFSNGLISIVDLRTGRLAGSSRPADSEISLLEPCGPQKFAVINPLTQSLSFWNSQTCALSHKIPGSFENVTCVRNFGNQLLCSVAPNKIRMYTSTTAKASFSESKLRSDLFSGSISTFEVLPLNRLMLVASSNGNIQLLC